MQHSDLFATLSANLEALESEILQLEETPADAARMQRIFQALGLEAQQWAAGRAGEALTPLKEGRVLPDQKTVDAFLGLVEALKRLFYLASGEEGHEQGTLPAVPETASVAALAQESQSSTTTSQEHPAPAPPAGKPDNVPIAKRNREQTFIKVNTRKLDELMESVQELVISSTMMGQTIQRAEAQSKHSCDAAATSELLEHDRCIQSIRNHVLDIRKMTLAATCTRMARLVREVAAEVGKDVELSASGQDVEVDKSIIDDLADPLVHLLRNAVDHGIETPDEREALGKARQGRINLRILHENNELVLHIEDDGKGLNKQRILDKARERGLISQDKDASQLPDREIFGLIMQPGFSTAEKVSSVSGRGVGMDVVAQSLRVMLGELEISSEAGQGSRFTIRVPADKAALEGITQGVLVKVGDQHFVLRSGCVREVFRPSRGSVHTLAEEGEVISARQGNLPYYRAHCLLDITPCNEAPEESLAVVLEAGKELLVLQVDDVLGERQVVVRTFAGMEAFLGQTLFSGVAFIGKMTAMILDADRFLHNALQDNTYLSCRFAVCSHKELT